MGTIVLAWESSNYAWNSFAHSLGAFLTSPGFAGTAALLGAFIAAHQVKKTRDQDIENRDEDRKEAVKTRGEDLAEARRVRQGDLDEARRIRQEDLDEARTIRGEDRAEQRQVRADAAAADSEKRRGETLWRRFEWVIDRSSTYDRSGQPVLSQQQTATILASIRVSADDLGDQQLADMIRTFRSEQINDLGIWG